MRAGASWLLDGLLLLAAASRCKGSLPHPPSAALPAALPLRPSPLQVSSMLQGQAVPRHLLNEHPAPPTFDIQFGSVPDLAIRTNSYCTR